MSKGLAFLLLLTLCVLALFSTHSVPQTYSMLSDQPIMIIQNVQFAFGWSAAIGEIWTVNGENISLNTLGLVTLPSTPIEGDAGTPQENNYLVYANNVGFSYGWSSNISDLYRPSNSMVAGAAQAVDNKGVVEPTYQPINGDAGSTQENPTLIYLNNVGFSFGWSANSSEEYSPSSTTQVGPLTPLNGKALVVPPEWSLGIDTTPPVTSDNYNGAWHNADFTVTLTATDNESGVAETYYKINNGLVEDVTTDGQPNITTEGANNTLEYWSVDNAGNEEPHHVLTGIKLDKTPPTIGVPSLEPESGIQPNQPVTVSVNATDALSQIHNTTLYFTLTNGTTWEEPLSMELNTSTSLYEATIPGQPIGAYVGLKIVAYDYAGNNATRDWTEPNSIYHVIPEFPTVGILPLLIFFTTFVAVVAMKKMLQKPHPVASKRFQ